MQAEVSSLPVVQLSTQKSSIRKENHDTKSPRTQVKLRSPVKSATCLPACKKPLNPLLGGPYRSNVKHPTNVETSKKNDANMCQRVLSAKMLRLKQLQNQLADAHYHLNELANENRLLKALQKRQDTALKRYEGTNAELPRIINTHHEELRVLQIKYKKLKAVHKESCDQLKERDAEILCLQSQNKHLSQLCKNRNLQEREKLQVQVADLTHRIQQQQDTIQELQRKLSLESRSMKHQLQTEISKRKDAEKHLKEATNKLNNLEALLDNREKRLYYNGQLQTPSKDRRFATQSLTNLTDVSVLNIPKLSIENRKSDKILENDNLTLREISEGNDEEDCDKEKFNISSTSMPESFKTETMASLQQIRKFRLQKSSRKHTTDLKVEEDMDDDTEDSPNINDSITMKDEIIYHKASSSTIENLYENYNFNTLDRANLLTRVEPDYSSDATDSDDESGNSKVNFCFGTATTSRALHARLTGKVGETTHIMEEIAENSPIKNKENEIDEYENDIKKEITKIDWNEQKPKSPLMLTPTDNALLDRTSDILQTNTNLQDEEQNHIKKSYNSLKNLQENPSAAITLKEPETNGASAVENDQHEQPLSDSETEQTVFQQEHYPSSHEYGEKMVDSNVTQHSNERQDSDRSDKNDESLFHDSHSYNVNIINERNIQDTSVELESLKALPNDNQDTILDNQQDGLSKEVDTISKADNTTKTINYDKEKLLATMRAIDNNENIEFITPEYPKHTTPSRKQITENLFRGVPTHSKSKQDILNDIFSTSSIENKSNNNYSKLH